MKNKVPEPDVEREKIHTRKIFVEGYKRIDGMWDIEGHLTDVKTADFTANTATLPAGEPIHEMWLRITIDSNLTIVAAKALSIAVPYPGVCDSIAPDYDQLTGLGIKAGFRNKVLRLFGGTRGCTHITELILAMATGAIQTMADQISYGETEKPFSLDSCHALDTTGPIVAEFHPRWFKKAE